MLSTYCFDKFFVILLTTILILSVSCLVYGLIKYKNKLINCKNKPCSCPQQDNIIREETPTPDIIRDYDYRKLADPLEEPTRRVARHEIQPFYLKQMIDLPTHGYPDNFTQLGVLVKVNNLQDTDTNRVLRLFGRQEYPRSYKYEYYTAINSGLDQIKIPLDIKTKKELYDDDEVYIKELNSFYTVNLHKFDAPKYYPDII